MQTYLSTHSYSARLVRGFTLIELVITVAIVGILAGVAYPSYMSYVTKGRRADARAAILQASEWMERFYSENNRYDQNTAGVAVKDLFSGAYSQVPANSTSANYTIALEATSLTQRTYRIVATRSGIMANDECGDFTVTNTGLHSVINYSSKFSTATQAVQACWR